MIKLPHVVELLQNQLAEDEQVIWADESKKPKRGQGCLIITLVFSAFITIFSLAENGAIAFVFGAIGFSMIAILRREADDLYYLMTDKKIYFVEDDTFTEIPFKHLEHAKIIQKRGNHRGDISLRTKVKWLNTKDYKFYTQEDKFELVNVPNYLLVLDRINDAHQVYRSLNPPGADDIEVDDKQ